MMADLKPLIAELEQAKEGSRELSDRVLLAVGWTTSDSKDTRARFWRSPEGEDYDWWDDPHARSRGGPPLKRPSPTESLDDALTLVPEGFAIEDFMIWPGHPASLTILGTHKDGDKYWHNSSDGRRKEAESWTSRLG